jgi:hypothetical protein
MFTEQATTTIVVALFGFLTTVASLTAAYFTARMKQSAERSEGTLEKVHVAVNSNYQEIVKKFDQQTADRATETAALREEITALKVSQATAQERQSPTAPDGSTK